MSENDKFKRLLYVGIRWHALVGEARKPIPYSATIAKLLNLSESNTLIIKIGTDDLYS